LKSGTAMPCPYSDRPFAFAGELRIGRRLI
jgi:hypothetical protein